MRSGYSLSVTIFGTGIFIAYLIGAQESHYQYLNLGWLFNALLSISTTSVNEHWTSYSFSLLVFFWPEVSHFRSRNFSEIYGTVKAIIIPGVAMRPPFSQAKRSHISWEQQTECSNHCQDPCKAENGSVNCHVKANHGRNGHNTSPILSHLVVSDVMRL